MRDRDWKQLGGIEDRVRGMIMKMNEYQKAAMNTAIYPNIGNNPTYTILGLCGEAGEIANKFKKVIRDQNGVMTQQTIDELADELGDVLWYVAMTAAEIELDLDSIADLNINKLMSRKSRGVIKGKGDCR